jgi:hypothetical protein
MATFLQFGIMLFYQQFGIKVYVKHKDLQHLTLVKNTHNPVKLATFTAIIS